MRFHLADGPFASRSGRGVTVAVLDSGIHGDHPHVGGIQGGVALTTEADASDLVDRIGHGTAVAAAIREKSPDVALLAVKIFHTRLATNADVLARAIEWAADQGAALINLSLGTANPAHADRLAEAVRYANTRGSLVVSAFEANDVLWLPGSLEGVIGVRADASLDREALDVTRRDDGRVLLTASPFPRPIPNVPRERNVSGVSFAVANASGFLARVLEGGGSIDTLGPLHD